ncbi:glycosyl transferase [Aestuarium zhoushanense]|nr:glycosyl transferase [Aestuarium zhoushanense]
MTTLSCIIPAYNEASRIDAVLRSVVGHPLIDEVIVVDDGSSDGTAEVVKGIDGVRLIELPQNKGKTWAVTVGIEAATGDTLMFVDADLLGLDASHLTALIAPVQQGKADITISLRANAPRPWHWIGIDYISGERVMPRGLLIDQIDTMRALPKFGLEVFMNSLLIRQSARIAIVQWPEVESPLKGAKFGWSEGLKRDVKMIRDMAQTVGLLGLAAQVYRMRRQRVV